MDTASCQRLINRILAYWELEPSTLRCRAWEHALIDLEEGRAGTAFMQCTKKHSTISPALFLQTYADIKVDTNYLPSCPRCEGTARTTQGEDCPQCSGTGRAERPSLKPISRSQHLTNLKRLADIGNRDAIEELARWHRFARNHPAGTGNDLRITISRDAILKALDD